MGKNVRRLTTLVMLVMDPMFILKSLLGLNRSVLQPLLISVVLQYAVFIYRQYNMSVYFSLIRFPDSIMSLSYEDYLQRQMK